MTGFEIQAAPALNLGVRYIRRTLGRVLEDYAPAQPVLYDLGFVDQVEFFVGNVDASLETLDPTSIGVPQAFFEDSIHTYDAVEW